MNEKKFVIAHIITRLICGGADENTIYSCNKQVNEGYIVYLVFGAEFESEVLKLLDKRVRIIKVQKLIREINIFKDINSLLELVNIFEDIKPDIVHTHTSKAGFLGRAAAAYKGIKVIIHGVHILPFLNVAYHLRIFYLLCEWAVMPFTTCYISVSKGMMDACLKYKLGNRSIHHVVHSGMDIQKFLAHEDNSDSWKSLFPNLKNYFENPRFLVLVSRLEKRKRQYEFLDIFQEICSLYPNTVLVIVGSGIMMKKLKDKATRLKLNKHIVFTGHKKDVEKYISIADMCIMCSRNEGLPRVLIQYLACKKPIVTTNYEGIEHIIHNGKNGFVVDTDNISSMIEPISNLLEDSKLRNNFSDFDQNIDLSKWSMDEMHKSLVSIYMNLINQNIKLNEENISTIKSPRKKVLTKE